VPPRPWVEPVFLAALTRSKARSVNREIKDVGIVVGNVLDSITVMDVPVEDKDAFGPSGMDCLRGRFAMRGT